MQHPNSAEENLRVDASQETAVNTQQLLEIQQLRAQLWLERCLNQLRNRLDDCLRRSTAQPAATSSSSEQTQKTAQELEAEIFQTVVNELSAALKTDSVALALANTKLDPLASASEPVCQICYCAPTQKALSSCGDTSQTLSAVDLAAKTLCLQRGQALALEDLQQLQHQQPQAAWSLHDQQGILGWLIAPMLPGTELEALQAEYKPQLIERSLNAAMLALVQSRRLQATFLHCQQLEAHNRELAGANKLKSEFLANTSHEIRTPLSSILGFTHLLQVQSYSPSNLRHQEYLNIILSSGQHLLALLNDILDLSKIEANQLEIHCETVDIAGVCRSVIALVKEKASDKGLELHLDLDSTVNNLVVDCLRLKQMLFNLLSNALKFTNKGAVGLQIKHKGAFLHFTVWDTGIGIPKEEQAKLFQPYSQIAHVVAGRQEGTGLGLALTHKLAELHKGWVEVQSELNKGSKFTIVLPLPGAKVERWGDEQVGRKTELSITSLPHHPITPSPSATKTSILLVEDNVHNAKLITTYLKKLGYQVDWVKNAQQMWQALEGPQPALILMDVHLPDTDGLTLLQQLQAHKQYRTIPVIAQTAMAMKGDRETCLAAGAIEYISKPIDFKVLASLVSEYSDTRNV